MQFDSYDEMYFQVHAYVISALKKDMPSVFGKEGKKKELIKNLDSLYSTLQRVCIKEWIKNLDSLLHTSEGMY